MRCFQKRKTNEKTFEYFICDIRQPIFVPGWRKCSGVLIYLFLSGNGRFLARVTGEVRGNVTLRKQQYRIREKREESVAIARNFISMEEIRERHWIM